MPQLPTETPWTVSQLTRAAKRAVEGSLGALWIRGEVSGFKAWASGHWYFTLRDKEAQVSCTMWKGQNQKVPKPPQDGQEVFLFGKPSIYEEKGSFQFSALELLLTEALGAQQLAYEKARAALEKDGLFEVSRKRPLPRLPRGIAIVTSPDGAALRDIIRVTHTRWAGMPLYLIGTRVQGPEAEAELVRALGIVNRLEVVDLCIVGRGGGSREDLAAFDSELVCRAIAAVRVPVISAVGHETDISLADLVADVRAATPSAAAEIAVPDAADLDSPHPAGLGTAHPHHRPPRTRTGPPDRGPQAAGGASRRAARCPEPAAGAGARLRRGAPGRRPRTPAPGRVHSGAAGDPYGFRWNGAASR